MRRPVVVLALVLALALVAPRGVEAAEPDVHFEPGSGGCDGPFTVVGTGYPANTPIEIAIPGMTESTHVAETTSDSRGSFRIDIAPGFANCHPGRLVGVAAIAEPAGAPRVFRIAAYEVASPYTLTMVQCDARTMTLAGGGYPPGTELTFLLVPDQPFYDNVAVIGTTVVGPRSEFQADFGMGCPPAGQTITAGSGEIAARLGSAAIITPAGTGHGRTRSGDRRLPVALAIVALVTLGTARHVRLREPLS